MDRQTYLFLLQHVCLPQYLHGVHMPSVQFLYQCHLPKCPSADDLQALEVLLAQSRPPQAQKLSLLLSMLVSVLLPLE